MARDAIDAAVRELGEEPRTGRARPPTLRLVGAAERAELDRFAAALASRPRAGARRRGRLVGRHGRKRPEVAALGAEEGLLRPLGPEIGHIEAEVAWAAREEMALSLDDVLARRMRLVQELPDRGASIVPRVAELLGGSSAGTRPARSG